MFELFSSVTLKQHELQSTNSTITHTTFRHCRLCFYAFVGQPLSKQLPLCRLKICSSQIEGVSSSHVCSIEHIFILIKTALETLRIKFSCLIWSTGVWFDNSKVSFFFSPLVPETRLRPCSCVLDCHSRSGVLSNSFYFGPGHIPLKKFENGLFTLKTHLNVFRPH